MNGPAGFIKPHLNGLAVDSNFFRPVPDQHGAPIMSKWASPRAIADLFRACGPAHIAGFIIAAVVNAIHLVIPRWGRTNVIEKGLERLRPFLAHSNASAAISRVVFHRRIFASSDHGVPGAPFFSTLSFHSVSVFVEMVVFAFTHTLFLKTTTALRFLRAEGVRLYGTFRSAIAATKKPLTSMLVTRGSLGFSDNSPATNLFADHEVIIPCVVKEANCG